MRKPKQIAGCYLYPENGKLFVQVAVMRTQADIRALAKHWDIPAHSKLGGFCKPIGKCVRGKSRRFAVVGLCKNRIGPSVVAHEMTHMALVYLDEMGDLPQDPLRSANERLCYLVGDSTSAFYGWAKEKGLY